MARCIFRRLTVVFCLLMALTSFVHADITNGLLLSYTFDGDSGTNVMDSSGNGRDGTSQGTTHVAGGRGAGSVMDFHPTSCVAVASDVQLEVTASSDNSYSFWWKADAVGAPTSELLAKRAVADLNLGLSFSYIFSEQKYYLVNQIDHWVKWSAPVSTGEWNHVTLTKDGGTWLVYHNAAEQSQSGSMGWPFGGDLHVDVPLWLGRDPITGALDGRMDDVRVYSRALSSEDVTDIYLSEVFHRLDTGVTGMGFVDIADGWHTNGAEVIVTATASNGYRLALWSGDVPSANATDNPLSLAMDQSRSVTAVFVEDVEDDISRGLVAFYTFDADIGTNVVDASGNDRHGTSQGTTHTEGRTIGSAMDYHPTSCVSVASDAQLEVTASSDNSYSFWWKADAVGAPTSELLAKRAVADLNLGLSFSYIFSEQKYYLVNQVDHWVKWSALVSTGEWNHVTLTKDGGTWRVYHNAVEQSQSGSMGWPFGGDLHVDVPLWLGRDPITGAFNGQMDDVRIYDRVVSGDEVQEIYGLAAPSLVGHWPMDGNASDASGLGNHGLVMGATLAADRFGQSNKCYRFDGVNDGIEVTNHPSLMPSDGITLSAWVKREGNPANSGVFLARRFGGPTGSQWSYGLFEQPSRELWFSFDDGDAVQGWQHLQSGSLLSTGTWTHVVGIYDGSAQRMYVDGVLVATRSVSGSIVYDPRHVYIGNYDNWQHFFNGCIDDVMMFNRGLSAEEVGNLYFSQLGSSNTVRLTVLGSPGDFGAPLPYGYGMNVVSNGAVATNAVGSPVSQGSGVRQVCTGWTGAGGIPASGSATQVVFTADENSSLTWTWRQEHLLDTEQLGMGQVDIADVWLTDGTSLVVTATASNGHHFVYWYGDVSQDQKLSNPLVVTMDQARSLTAVFASDAGGPPPGALLHLTMDVNSSPTVNDSSGLENDGTEIGASWVASGLGGGAYLFDGVNDTVSVLQDASLAPTSAVTLSVWVRLANDPSGLEMFASRRIGASSQSYSIFQQGDREVWFGVNNGQGGLGDQHLHAGYYLATNQWTHLAGTYDGAVQRVYANGVLVATQAVSGAIQYGSYDTQIGSYNNSESFFDGKIDEVMMYGRALNPGEILQLYSHGLGISGASNTVALVIDGDPSQYGVSVPFDYGSNTVVKFAAITNDVISPVLSSNGTRYVCSGWTGTGDITSGSGTSVVFTATTNSSLTWQWYTEYYVDVAVAANGSVDVGDSWHSNGVDVVLTATASNGHHFEEWSGDVPGGTTSANPLTVTMDQARNIGASFAVDTFVIAGSVYYTGPQDGAIYVEAFSDSSYMNRVAWTQIAQPGSYAITGVDGGGDYWVRAYRDSNASGTLDAQEPIGGYADNPLASLAASVSGVDMTLLRISAPQGVEADGGFGSVTVSWEPNAEPGVAGYYVYRFDSEWGQFERLNPAPINDLTFVDRTINASVTYYYYVSAVVQSDFSAAYMESPASAIVDAIATGVTLWMPDYSGDTGSTVRLRINISDAEGILGNDMALTVSYDPNLLIPITQTDTNKETVEKTVLTQDMTVSNDALIANGQIQITAIDTNPGVEHATLHILGCAYEWAPHRPVSIVGSYSNNGASAWTPIYSGRNINDGRQHSVDLGPLTDGTNCVLFAKEQREGRTRRSDDGSDYVKVLRNGDNVANVQGINNQEDVYYYLRGLVNESMILEIGPKDVVYLFEMSTSTNGPAADYQDVVAYVQYEKGSTLEGQGHLFDVIFAVTNTAAYGTKTTNTIVTATLKDGDGNTVAVDYSDEAVLTVQTAYILGDVNGDGVVTVSGDFVLAMRLALGKVVTTAQHLMAGDIDGDGKITKHDATLINRIAHGKPICPEDGQADGYGGVGEEPVSSGYVLSVGDHEFQPGTTLQVPISIDNATDVASFNLRLNFDGEMLILQGVTNTTLTQDFDFDYNSGAGYVDILMSSSNALVSGSGNIALVDFFVSADAVIGSASDLTISEAGLGDEYGGSIGEGAAVVSSNGNAAVIMSNGVDSDGDGLTDYEEQFRDGKRGYSPWHSVSNAYGRDTDIFHADTDRDGMNDGKEHNSGTSPFDRSDLLSVRELVSQQPDEMTVRWSSVTNKLYAIERATNLITGFSVIVSNVPGTNGVQSFVDTNVVQGLPNFYRVKAE